MLFKKKSLNLNKSHFGTLERHILKTFPKKGKIFPKQLKIFPKNGFPKKGKIPPNKGKIFPKK
jgi:hypothetical protein